MIDLFNAIPVSGLSIAVLCIIVILLILLILTIFDHIKLKKILRNCSNGRLDECIEMYYNKVNTLAEELALRENNLSHLENLQKGSIQKIAMKRYNAFPDVGSELSYSLAILDGYNNGFVMTSIYGRDSSNTYLKPVTDGKSQYPLSDEETQVIASALDIFEKRIKS